MHLEAVFVWTCSQYGERSAWRQTRKKQRVDREVKFDRAEMPSGLVSWKVS